MRVIASAGLALGIVGAMSAMTPQPVQAQGAYIYGPGVSVEIGPRPYRYRHYYWHHHHGYYGEPYAAYYYSRPYPYDYGYYGTRQRCEPGYTWRNGACRP